MKTGSSCREHVRQRISLSFQFLFLCPWEDIEIHNTILCNFDHRGWLFESVYGVLEDCSRLKTGGDVRGSKQMPRPMTSNVAFHRLRKPQTHGSVHKLRMYNSDTLQPRYELLWLKPAVE